MVSGKLECARRDIGWDRLARRRGGPAHTDQRQAHNDVGIADFHLTPCLQVCTSCEPQNEKTGGAPPDTDPERQIQSPVAFEAGGGNPAGGVCSDSTGIETRRRRLRPARHRESVRSSETCAFNTGPKPRSPAGSAAEPAPT